MISGAEQALAAGADSADLRNLLGLSCARTGNFGPAIKAFDSVAAMAPDFLDIHFNTALAHRWLGNLNAVIESYLLAIEADPCHAETHYNLATTFFEL